MTSKEFIEKYVLVNNKPIQLTKGQLELIDWIEYNKDKSIIELKKRNGN